MVASPTPIRLSNVAFIVVVTAPAWDATHSNAAATTLHNSDLYLMIVSPFITSLISRCGHPAAGGMNKSRVALHLRDASPAANVRANTADDHQARQEGDRLGNYGDRHVAQDGTAVLVIGIIHALERQGR